MNRTLQGVVLLVIGVVLGRLGMTDAHLTYVKGTLQIPLVLSALVLLTLGILSLVRDQEDDLAAPEEPVDPPLARAFEPLAASTTRAHAPLGGPAGSGVDHPMSGEAGAGGGATVPIGDAVGALDDHGADHAGGHGHDHSTAPRIGMLMLVPMLVLLLVAPQPLGSYAANQGGVNRVSAPSDPLDPLPAARDGATDTTLDDVVVRALHDPTSLEGQPARLIGFVVNDPDAGGGYRLSRFSIACCAADAAVRQVIVDGAASVMPDDTWVEVVGRFEGTVVAPDGEDDPTRIPVFRVLEQHRIEPPASPYE